MYQKDQLTKQKGNRNRMTHQTKQLRQQMQRQQLAQHLPNNNFLKRSFNMKIKRTNYETCHVNGDDNGPIEAVDCSIDTARYEMVLDVT